MKCHNCGRNCTPPAKLPKRRYRACRRISIKGTCSVEAWAWTRPCEPGLWGTPCSHREHR